MDIVRSCIEGNVESLTKIKCGKVVLEIKPEF